ncbi:hypothetical protein ACFWBN_27890 [Streptomyces sp. NPDC059989]|uniref:hypothetical protein n=1 Tax=Streptomyces sp. NPDC059989 TaxID=3347026 RepID=UPI0036ACC524
MAEEIGTQPDRQPSALDIAAQWAQLPAEHLAVALGALEPQLAREHKLRMEVERARGQAELTRLRAEAAEQQRVHGRHVLGVYAGLAVALATLGASVYFGTHDQPWLAITFFGPTLLALVKIFTLRRSDADDAKHAAAAARTAAANLPAQPPPPI